MLEMICKELGVEVGEEWLGDDGYEHQISKKGTLRTYIRQGASVERCEISNELWLDIVVGELKPVWKPQKGDKYYIPYIDAIEEERYNFLYWKDEDTDNWYRHNDLMFKTKEEAIERANEMLEVVK